MVSRRELAGLSELLALRRIWPLLALRPWATFLLTGLGILNSLVEWVGIALLIPLLAPAYGGAQAGPLYGLLLRPFSGLPSSRRSLVVTAVMLAAIGLKVVFAYLYNLNCSKVTDAATHELRLRTFSQIMRLGPSYFDAHPAARTITLAGSLTEGAGQAVAQFAWLLVSLSAIVISTSMLFLLSFWMTCTLGLSMLLVSILSRRLSRNADSLARTYYAACSDLQNRIAESVAGIATICSFVRERSEEERHAAICSRIVQTNHELRKSSALITPVTEGLMVAVLLVLMVLAMLGQMPFAMLATFSFLLYRLLPQVSAFEHNRVALVKSSVAVEEVFQFLSPLDKKYVRSGARDFSGLQNGIVLREVTFQYPTRSTPAVRDVSLHIEKGKLTALVGPSGAGKSTLANLICRFYDIDSGEISVDGTPLHCLDLAAWRRRLAVVSQDPFLFAETIRENIRLGQKDATEAQIILAARQANAHEFILELPQGYDTLVGDRGVRLSGGQRQRIAIARAFLCDADILIFDEATSDLDGLSEGLFRDAIRSLRHDRTIIAIAHRLSTIEEADQIVVLQDGSVVEHGQLDELLQQNGLFASLYRVQHSAPASLLPDSGSDLDLALRITPGREL